MLYGTMVNLKHYSSNDLFLLDQFTPCTNIILGQSKLLLTHVIWSQEIAQLRGFNLNLKI